MKVQVLNAHTRYAFVDFLKAIAIALIINSHAKWMYPDTLSFLGIGGAWGCALFFFVSGFTMANMKTDSFLKYIVKRVLRIYPAVWLWYAFSWCFLEDFHWSYLLWPRYWFLQSILIYYLLFYPIIKYAKDYLHFLISGGLIASVLCFFLQNHDFWIIDLNTNPVTKIWYFFLFLFGAYIRNSEFQHKFLTVSEVCNQRFLLSTILIGSFIGCYGLKFVIQKYDSLINLQVLFPLILFVACFFIGTMCKYYTFSNSKIGTVIEFISARTLEIYIVQQLFIYDRFAEPITGLGALIATLFIASFLHWICNSFLSGINLIIKHLSS